MTPGSTAVPAAREDHAGMMHPLDLSRSARIVDPPRPASKPGGAFSATPMNPREIGTPEASEPRRDPRSPGLRERDESGRVTESLD